jgi:hypothetical protein
MNFKSLFLVLFLSILSISFCKDIVIFDENVLSYSLSTENMNERNLEIQIDSDDTTEMYCLYFENYFSYHGIVVDGNMQKKLIADFNKYKEWNTKAIQLKTTIEKPIDTIDVEKAFFQTVDKEWHPCFGYKRIILNFVSDNPSEHYLQIEFIGFKNNNNDPIVTEIIFLSIDNINMLIKKMNQAYCNPLRIKAQKEKNVEAQFN